MDCLLYCELPEAVYSEQYRRTHVAKLHMALEGSKQGGALWRKGNKKCLVDTCGFQMLDSDPTLFIKWFDSLFILLIVWVDDIVAAYHAKLAEEFTAFFNLYN